MCPSKLWVLVSHAVGVTWPLIWHLFGVTYIYHHFSHRRGSRHTWHALEKHPLISISCLMIQIRLQERMRGALALHTVSLCLSRTLVVGGHASSDHTLIRLLNKLSRQFTHRQRQISSIL